MKKIYITMFSGLLLAGLAIACTSQDCYSQYQTALAACKGLKPITAKRACQVAAYQAYQTCLSVCQP